MILIVGWAIITLINIVQLVFVEWFNPKKYNLNELLVFPIVTFFWGLLLIFLWVIPGYEWLKNRKNVVRIPLFIVHGVAYGMIYILPLFWILMLWFGASSEWYVYQIKRYFLNDFHNVLKNYVYLIATVFAIDYLKERSQALSRQKELENQLLTSKLQMVEAQLQPHFLFNALNGVVATIDESKVKAQKALIQLSELLRFSLNYQTQTLITLQEEMALLDHYLSIEKLRYEEQLKVIVEADQLTQSKLKLPGMILQPIVENAIKHGFKGLAGQLTIWIMVEEASQKIVVKNNGTPLPQHIHSGKGLKLVKQRVQHHFPNCFSFNLEQQNDWVITTIILN